MFADIRSTYSVRNFHPLKKSSGVRPQITLDPELDICRKIVVPPSDSSSFSLVFCKSFYATTVIWLLHFIDWRSSTNKRLNMKRSGIIARACPSDFPDYWSCFILIAGQKLCSLMLCSTLYGDLYVAKVARKLCTSGCPFQNLSRLTPLERIQCMMSRWVAVGPGQWACGQNLGSWADCAMDWQLCVKKIFSDQFIWMRHTAFFAMTSRF